MINAQKKTRTNGIANINVPPMPSRKPNFSLDNNAALTVPKIISDSTRIEKSPAPILLGLHKITILGGIKKTRESNMRSGNIDVQDSIYGNGPNASEKISDVNIVTIKP